MNIEELQVMVKASECFYEPVDKNSLKELTEFLGTFHMVYAIFQERSRHLNLAMSVSAELSQFYTENEFELSCLSNKVLAIADSIENEMLKFREPIKNFSSQSNFFQHQESKKTCAPEPTRVKKEKDDGLSFMGGKKGFL